MTKRARLWEVCPSCAGDRTEELACLRLVVCPRGGCSLRCVVLRREWMHGWGLAGEAVTYEASRGSRGWMGRRRW
jgi:hypothetical protein